MSDLISREKAYKVLTEYYHHKHLSQHIALREALDRVPSAQERNTCEGCENDGVTGFIYTCTDCMRWYSDRYKIKKGDSE